MLKYKCVNSLAIPLESHKKLYPNNRAFLRAKNKFVANKEKSLCFYILNVFVN